MQSPRINPPPAITPRPNPLTKYSLLGSGAKLEQYAIQQVPLLGNVCLMGEATVWYARYNTGKTALCLQLILEAVSAGVIRPENVFYVNADDSSAGLAEKVKLFEDAGVHMLAPGHLQFSISELTAKMEDMIASDTAKGVVIIVDTLKRVVDVMDKKAVRAFTALVRRFVMKQGTFLALAHTNKTTGKDGRPVPEGTADILNDFDCAYLIDISNELYEGNRVVGFECVKSRGRAASRVWYAYDASPDLSYTERLCTIREVDPDEARFAERQSGRIDEPEIIEAILMAIKHGTATKMAIIETAAKATRSSRRTILEILERHTGPDPVAHRWDFAVKERGAKVYAPHPRPADGE